MKQIFISYSHKDIETMRRVHNALTEEGFTVWTDEKLTPGTEAWFIAIEQAIDTAGAVVVLLSPDAKKSEWVQKELHYADTQGVKVFPLLVRGNGQNAVPFQLGGTQYIDLIKQFDDGIEKLVASIHDYDAASNNQEKIYLEFWEAFLKRSRSKTTLFANNTPQPRKHMTASAGRANIYWQYFVGNDWVRTQLYIDLDRGQDNSGKKNKAVFDLLSTQKHDIERDFGEKLEWERMDDSRASRVAKQYGNIGGLATTKKWREVHDQMIDSMTRLEKALKNRVAEAVDSVG